MNLLSNIFSRKNNPLKLNNRAVHGLLNIDKKLSKKANVLSQINTEQLERLVNDISQWRSAVESAEDVDNPDKYELARMFKDTIDDYQVWSATQIRINKSTNGSFRILDSNGEIDKEEQLKFIDPVGNPLPWFRNFMKIIENAKFYGYSATQLGDIIDNKFKWVEGIPFENLIPLYDLMIRDAEAGYTLASDNVIDLKAFPQANWVITTGSKKDLGLLNKCVPYVIYKSVFGSWAQHADVFGMPLRIGKVDLNDAERRQNLIDMFENMTNATYGIFDPADEVEFISDKGGSDPHNIYGELINKCDAAISKIILSQTGTTDEKAFAGSAKTHENILKDVIHSDKLDIQQVVNEQLIPRMKKLGMIDQGKQIYAAWDFDEGLTIIEWSKVITELNKSYRITAEEAHKRVGIAVEEKDIVQDKTQAKSSKKTETDEKDDTQIKPDAQNNAQNKMTSIMNKVNDYYKSFLNTDNE